MNQAQFFCRAIKRLCNNTTLLPAEYQQAEYLRSSGSQYINTGISAAAGDIIDITIHFIAHGTFYNKAAMGSQGDSDTNKRTAIIWGYDGNSVYMSITSGDKSASLSPVHFDAKTYAELNYTVNDQSKKITGTCNDSNLTILNYGGNLANAPIHLFENNTSGYNTKISASVYYFKCVTNGRTTREFIPCYRISDNKPGMYDLVTNTFFTNAGTGEFTVGDSL